MEKQTTYNSSIADKFFASFPMDKVVSYRNYWDSITPQNTNDIFRRYLFAFTSIHTSWAGNVRGYNSIKNFSEWVEDKELLRQKLKDSRCGLYNNRTEHIWDFKDQFFNNPKDFILNSKKYHIKKRDSIVDKLKGIGTAKVSFALCMIHPLFARTLCGDTHILEMYGMKHLTYKTKEGFRKYRKMEQHFSVNCGKLNVPVEIARAIFWDIKQGQESSRYWTYCLED
jgi:thermostable 8-oxoguanine DNA glycosylase